MTEELQEYICAHTSPEPAELQSLDRRTHLHLANPRMSSGHMQGRLLKMLVAVSRPKLALELGTFSAYSTLCIAEGLPVEGCLHTIEANDEMEDFILSSLASSAHGQKVKLHIGKALDIIPCIAEGELFDFAFIDADKREYPAYYQAVKQRMRHGGLMVVDNTLWDGHVLAPPDQSGHVGRHNEQTLGVARFNDMVRDDAGVEQLILPLRDGLTLIRVL